MPLQTQPDVLIVVAATVVTGIQHGCHVSSVGGVLKTCLFTFMQTQASLSACCCTGHGHKLQRAVCDQLSDSGHTLAPWFIIHFHEHCESDCKLLAITDCLAALTIQVMQVRDCALLVASCGDTWLKTNSVRQCQRSNGKRLPPCA